MGTRIINYIRAGYPGLYLVSHEEQRVDGELKSICQDLKYSLVVWSAVDGLVDTGKNTATPANDPLEALVAIHEMKEKTIILFKDFHLFLQDPNPVLVRQLKDVLLEAKTKQKTLIVLGCRLCLPPELERELTVIEFALPGKEELGHVLSNICESASIKMEPELREKAIDAASGLTTIEAENAFALSVVESKGIDPAIVAREKAGAVKKNGILELVEAKESLDQIGGQAGVLAVKHHGDGRDGGAGVNDELAGRATDGDQQAGLAGEIRHPVAGILEDAVCSGEKCCVHNFKYLLCVLGCGLPGYFLLVMPKSSGDLRRTASCACWKLQRLVTL
jgi:hypothetical protein